uniref:RNA-directed DNA polymerase, eukaryota, reverse transcriptase zinc-binding domain protein n=1 Tax=Tanacetum cinerariifolium TaxID=118510 RepID=A0A699V9X4_TANCI|nr:RNA-directed DNA polymerase, eukaryota, reverse transcriptase zinc-binding domain protein [Tanacetum cinerariifolium]
MESSLNEDIPVKNSFNILNSDEVDGEDLGGNNVNDEFNSKVWPELKEENVRGLNNTPNQDQVIKLLREDSYSFCGLLETYVKKKNLSRICNCVLGRWEWVSNCSSYDRGTRIIVGWDPNHVNMMVLN